MRKQRPADPLPDPVPVTFPDGSTGSYQPGRVPPEPLLAPPPAAARRATREVAQELHKAWTHSAGGHPEELSPRPPREHATGEGTYTFTARHRGHDVVVVCIPVVDEPDPGEEDSPESSQEAPGLQPWGGMGVH
jgi:hypothetical protein